jgi:hybrid polyketide synthase/nonribosomal peptide synthetase ACE1
MIERHGSKPALKDGLGNSLTYAQMKDRIDSIAIRLMAAGATERTPVGVFQDPSADWICSMMAVFKVGAIYVPLDLRNSVARLASIVDAARPTIILTDLNTTSKFKAIGRSIATEILVSEIVTVKVSSSLPNRAKPEDPAVILFTSGTTGKPKGVILTHDNLRAQCEGYSRFCDIPSMVSVVLQQTNYNFDVSLDQIFAALADGGCLYVVPARDRGDPQAITKSMAAQGVTYTIATPSEYEMWFRYAPENLANCKSWQYAFGGGEHLHNGLIQEFANLAARDLPLLRLFNNYGPTEASLAITKGEVKHSDPELEAHVPAGFIIPNYQVVVVDENLSPVPCEASGEILAGGPGVAAGYLGLAEMTKEKFLHGHNIHPLAATTGRWYRTGDRGRLRQDGALYVDGRILGDSQVKIRGFRVELGEVEVVILEAAKGALSHAVVTARESGEDRFLAAHVVFAPEYPQHRRQDLIKHLESKLPLPTYMQPFIIVTLDSIPVTNNFKLDRKAILEMSLPEAAVGDLAHLADTEQKLAELWGGIIPHILGVNELTSETNFFDVGGNSILLVKLKAAIKRKLDSEPLLIDLMNSSTLGGMARIVSSASGSRTIDWDAETSLTKSLSAFIDKERAPNAKKGQSLSVILTGSTGYLGRHILSRLTDNPQVNEIHCLIRPETLSNLPPPSSSKVIFISTDLSKPLLGLTPSAFVNLSRKADVVINCAANRSF